MQMTRDAGQCRRFSWWSCHSGSFCLGKQLTLHCNVLILWHAEPLLSKFWMHQLYKYSVVLVCPQRRELMSYIGISLWDKSGPLGKVNNTWNLCILSWVISVDVLWQHHLGMQERYYNPSLHYEQREPLEMKWLGQGHRKLRLISSDSHNNCLGYFRYQISIKLWHIVWSLPCAKPVFTLSLP